MPRKRNPNARRGPLSKAEKGLLEAVAPKADIDEAAKALAPVLDRTPHTLKGAIIEARERLHQRAGVYTDLHLKAAQVAAEAGNSKPAEWALERLHVDGERVVEPVKQAEQAGTAIAVQVVLPSLLGGMKSSGLNNLAGVEVLDALPPADGPVEG